SRVRTPWDDLVTSGGLTRRGRGLDGIRSRALRGRTAGAHAALARGARRGDAGGPSGTARRAPRLRIATAQRLGPRVRDPRREVAPLDGFAQLPRDVRPPRPVGGVCGGRSRRTAR